MLDYPSIQVSPTEAQTICNELYQIDGEFKFLPGEIDFNFRVKSSKGDFILKISRPRADESYADFQNTLLQQVAASGLGVQAPQVIPDISGNYISKIKDEEGNYRLVRLLTWINGRLLSQVNPQGEKLLLSLGKQVGLVTKSLQGYQHPYSNRVFEWDLGQAAWTYAYIHLFEHNEEKYRIIKYFKQQFKEISPQYKSLRKGVIHNDANDNNVIVSDDLANPEVLSIIDYGDAIYSQIINDLATCLSYAIMHKEDVLAAAIPVIKGYHQQFTLLEAELEVLYTLVAMRLVISVTKSAINRQEEPGNEYLFISEQAAWDVLKKWEALNKNYAHYSFREACGFSPHPQGESFEAWANKQETTIQQLFPTLPCSQAVKVDMSVSSTWLGHESSFLDNDLSAYKIKRLEKENPHRIISGGYLETRPFYSTDAYKKEGNNGPEYRSVHLGVDFWVNAQTPIHALFDGEVICIHNNDFNKDYGPTLIIKHYTEDQIPFYTLYGHLTTSTLQLHQIGEKIKKGDLIAYVGNVKENGNWVPHLHFQVMLDMLGNTLNFPGVAFPKQVHVWKSICPDPNLLFKDQALNKHQEKSDEALIAYRKQHLGKGLSLSYKDPLKMVRGAGAYLIASDGRKYLDTVNNVAHVGHEHPKVVQAGQEQMAILNTNSRYLHENINEFAKKLLSTFPEKLSVVHFVNSGSEANELALRMARTYTGQKDMIAVEVGYHGNTNACIEVSSYKFDGKGGSGGYGHTHIVPMPDTYRGLHQGEEAASEYAAYIQQQIDHIQSTGRNIAGFICESILSCGGQIELPKNYLKTAYQAIRKAGGICIADEVQTGCGRVGSHFWAFELQEVVPDIVTIGKPIGNGHPLAAVVCTQEVADAFNNGMEFFNTFGGNPVSCAIGKSVLTVIEEEGLQKHALEVGNHLKQALGQLQKEYPIIGEVRGQGLFLGFELVNREKEPLAEHASYLANRMKDLGILMSTDGKDHNVLKIKPPMVFSTSHADELIYRIEQVLNEDFMAL